MFEAIGALLDFIFKVMLLSVVGGVALLGITTFVVTKVVKAISAHFNERKMLGGRGRNHVFQNPPEAEAEPVRASYQEQLRPQQQSVKTNAHNQQTERPAYVRFDVERGVDEGELRQVMHGYEQAPVVGAYAREVLQSLDARAFRMRSLLPEIDAKFAPRSISWEKFHTIAEAALDAVLKNCTLLANRVQSFDVTEYCNYELFQSQGGFATTPNPGQDRLERWRLVFDMRQEMDSLRASNEHLLTELGKLAAELRHLDSDKISEDNSDIVDDISRLVEETKYYR